MFRFDEKNPIYEERGKNPESQRKRQSSYVISNEWHAKNDHNGNSVKVSIH